MEDWFHGIPIDPGVRARLPARLERGVDVLLELLSSRGIRATFFVLGPIAESAPGIVRRIADAGHEIGCHGWSHDPLYTMDRERFAAETTRATAAVGDCVGKRVESYRAAYFSITARSMWALDVLAELGYKSDSSIFPIRNWRYGIPGYDPTPREILTPAGPIREFPISVRRILGRTIPVSGGAYFRLYPYWVTRMNVAAAERQGRPVVFYLHPWELDPDHPRIDFRWRARMTHYVNLRSTRPKLERLLADYAFTTLTEVLEDAIPRPRS